MKKVLLILTAFMLSGSVTFAQPFDITFGIPDVDVSTLNVGDDVIVPVIMVSRVPTGVPGSMVIGFDLFIGFDHTYLTWKGTNPAPLTGVQNFHALCPYAPADWLFNDNGTEMVALWQDPSYLGADFEDGAVLFEYIFTYEGGLVGSSPLLWGWAKSLQGDNQIQMVKGITAAFTDWFMVFDNVYGEDGSIFAIGVQPGLWTGAVSSDWFDGANWDDGNVPAGIDVTIPLGMPFDPIIETDDILLEVAWAGNLTTDAPIIINPFGYLTVDGTFTNNGSLLMLTNATDQASFICSSFAGAGIYEYDRYLEDSGTAPEEEYGWHYLSSPVAGFGSWNMMDYYLNTWDETISMWYQHVGQVDCTPAPEIFNDGMEGWSVKIDPLYDTYGCPNSGTGDVVEFFGVPNFGDQLSAITSTGVGVYPGFNLVGNPYPSYWNYDAFYFGPNWPGPGLIMDAIYYWDEDAHQYASYVNGTGVNGGGPYVPPAQAFFFETTVDVGLTFTDLERTHVYGLPYWKDATDLVRLLATANGFTDETVIRFDENSTVNRDNNDARKLKAGGNVPTLFTIASELELSINGMPATDLVPVYFECGEAGTYTIEAIETSEFAYVVLEDVLTGIQTDLLTDSYAFNYTEGTKDFIVHFTPMSTPELDANSIRIWSNEQNIYVNVPGTTNGDIVVFNMMGQEVISTDIEAGLNVIPVNEVNTYFVVKVLTSDNAVTGKVYIK